VDSAVTCVVDKLIEGKEIAVGVVIRGVAVAGKWVGAVEDGVRWLSAPQAMSNRLNPKNRNSRGVTGIVVTFIRPYSDLNFDSCNGRWVNCVLPVLQIKSE
jgi:hypothetical protein